MHSRIITGQVTHLALDIKIQRHDYINGNYTCIVFLCCFGFAIENANYNLKQKRIYMGYHLMKENLCNQLNVGNSAGSR